MAFAALNTGVSGVAAFTDAVGVVSDNIANVNTVGFKRTESQFSALVINSTQSTAFTPGGVDLRTQALISEQGLLASSSNPTALAIDGGGFFVVNDMPDADALMNIAYSRAGNFLPDENGVLTNTAGQQLLGVPVDGMGNLVSDLSDSSSFEPVDINNFTGAAMPTTTAELNGTISSSLPQLPAASVPEGSLALGVTDPTNPAAQVPQVVQTLFVIDSLGNQQELNVAFTRVDSSPTDFRVEVFAPNPNTLDTSVGAPNAGALGTQLVTSGVLTFNGDGTIAQYVENFPAGPTTVNPGPGNPIEFATTLQFDPSNGADNSTITFNFGSDDGNDGLVLSNSVGDLSTITDGALFGNPIGVDVTESGRVSVLFDNGVSQEIFQLPIATFPNPDGLSPISGPAFAESAASGAVNFTVPGAGGAGGVIAGALEESTVDLAQEFADLIVNQRAFSASARTISTADEILQELTNIV
ncbi:MAG: flagellar hook protein FlgE [Rhodothalassiaceae bacterium]